MSVAVIIPTFRHPEALARALKSVSAQTLRPLQVIVVDDGSGDETPEVVHRFPSASLIQQTNAGPAAARNRGLREATAKYVASLDHDDEWDPDFLRKTVEALESHSADVAWSNFRQVGDYAFEDYLQSDRAASTLLACAPESPVIRDHGVAKEFFLFTGGAASNSALVLRRERMGEGWHPESRVADDLLLMARMLFSPSALRCVFLGAPLWTKHEEAGGYSRSSEATVRRCLDDFELVGRMATGHLSPADQRRWRKKTGNLRYKLAYHCLWNTDAASAWQEARRALRQAGVTLYGCRLLATALLRKCARLAGIPPLSELRH